MGEVQSMDYITDFLKILVPAALVLYAMYLTIRSFLQKQFDNRLLDLKLKNTETILPIRLQAYERMALFLERISPNNMLLRLSEPAMSAPEFQQLLLKEIREEFNHNLSQQVYMSDQVWEKIRTTMNEVVTAIQTASQKMDEKQNAIDLAEEIFDYMIKLNRDPIGETLSILKGELRQLL